MHSTHNDVGVTSALWDVSIEGYCQKLHPLKTWDFNGTPVLLMHQNSILDPMMEYSLLMEVYHEYIIIDSPPVGDCFRMHWNLWNLVILHCILKAGYSKKGFCWSLIKLLKTISRI
jgi:hypothetical protein